MENIISKENMDSVKALAETNVKISEAKNALFKLKEDETSYLLIREKKVLKSIQKLHDDSAEIIKETKNNWKEVHELLNEASTLATFIIEAQGNFHKLLENFEEKDKLWQESVKKQEKETEEIKKLIKKDTVQIANDKKTLARERELIAIDKRKLADDQALLERNIRRLKENKI